MLSEKIHMTYASSLAVGHMNLRTTKTPRRSDFEKNREIRGVFEDCESCQQRSNPWHYAKLTYARVAGNGAIRGIK